METEFKYFSDVTNRQWQLVRQLLPRRSRRGRKPIDRRRVINAIFYVVRTGCQWRMLPKDFPNWNTVYGIFGAGATMVHGKRFTTPCGPKRDER